MTMGVSCGHRENERDALRVGLVLKLTTPALDLPGLGSAILILRALWAVDVVRIHRLVLLLLLLGELFPVLTLLGGESLPLLADRLGEICLALLAGGSIDSGCCLLLCLLAVLTALAPEENERVLRALDVVLVPLFRPTLNVATA